MFLQDHFKNLKLIGRHGLEIPSPGGAAAISLRVCGTYGLSVDIRLKQWPSIHLTIGFSALS
jgi:hypothetical protein